MGLGRTLIGRRAAVASEQPLASLSGYDVLRKGGNAFDAAVAVSYSLAVTFHPAGGLGGDFFGMFYEAKTGRVHCLNASGWSPSGLTLELVRERGGGKIPTFGPLTCVVPGFVAGVSDMHKRLGTLEFKELLAPALEYASGGFPAGEGICRSVAGAFQELPREAKGIFAPSGKPTVPGEKIRQERLAEVISDVAEGGERAFYAGWPAEKIASALDSLGVPCRPEDFAEYKPEWVQPLTLDYRGTTVYEVPPNSMGATSLLILKLLSGANLSAMGPLSGGRIETTMRAVLAAYLRRDQMLGDPRFGKIDLDLFMSPEVSDYTPQSTIRSGDTTAFSVADGEGNMVSGIQSLFNHFGSRVFVPECGIALNNRASGFSTAGPNMVAPRKRPLHTLSSIILERGGRPYLAIGASGGDYRPMQHALFVTNSVDYSMPAEQNVSHPRFLWGGGKTLLVEHGYELPKGGDYDVRDLPMPGRTGVCQAVEVADGYRKAVCDVRGDGVPAGF
ncbi:MAG: gamma-glutamyltransferase family protein [Nitrososphaerota archaeon]|nr:gamma-glutamyltransferase family protein [Nitrososphaerota archaeon]MDG6983312.1 gamma-glutamyltransferase family protein [Nitrososphaerota archaeon]